MLMALAAAHQGERGLISKGRKSMSGKMNWKRVEEKRKIFRRGSIWGGRREYQTRLLSLSHKLETKLLSRGL
jgi:hypothetical protein